MDSIVTKRDPVVDTYHGDRVVDPYRWLEDDGSKVQHWTDRQNQRTRRHLRSNSACPHLAHRFEALTTGPFIEDVAGQANSYFREVRQRDDNRSSLLYTESPFGDERLLFDPAAFDDGVAMDWWVPSFDGRRIMYGIASDGTEQYDINVVNCGLNTVINRIEDVGSVKPFLVAWHPNSSGIYYVRTRETDAGLKKSIRFRDLERDTDERIHADVSPGVWPRLVTAEDSPHLVASFSEGFNRSDVYRWEPERGEFEPLLANLDGLFKPRLAGETMYLLTSFEADNFRIVSVDVTDATTMTELVPEREQALLQDFFLFDDSIATHYVHDGHSTVQIHALDGTERKDVSFEEFVTVQTIRECPGTDQIVQYESFEHPTSVGLIDGDSVRMVAESTCPVQTTITVEQEYYESADGTTVPMFVVSGEEATADGTGPAVLRGYGGFRQCQTPTFDPYLLPFLEDGGIYVQPNLRGGGEFGTQWHRAGREMNKRHTFEDFVAAAEHVIERGYAADDRLVAWGQSNGGLTVGAAVTMRPDLFAGVICDAPILDMLRIDQFALGETWVQEYGDPQIEAEYRYLQGYSPYHNVEDAPYPPVLLETDWNDTRVHPSHARKMAAKMQAHTTGDGPILLHTTDGIGHGSGPSTADLTKKRLVEWGFVYDCLGMDG